MLDVNYPLQKAYLIALTGITYESAPVPVYYQALPDNIQPENYIIFGPITNNDISTKSSANTASMMRVTIHTHQSKYNTGKAVNFIAGEVLNRIYATSQSKIDLSPDNLQCYGTELFSDLTQDYNIQNSRVYIDRILIFSHKINHR